MDIFIPIFRALESAGVQYLTVGGLATVLHGYARFTTDIDLIVNLEEKNCKKAIETLLSLSFKPRAPVDALDFAVKKIRDEWIANKGLTVFSMYNSSGIPIEIDLFVQEPMNFEELWNKRITRVIDGTIINVIDKNSLIELKRMSNRQKDIEDVNALLEIEDE